MMLPEKQNGHKAKGKNTLTLAMPCLLFKIQSLPYFSILFDLGMIIYLLSPKMCLKCENHGLAGGQSCHTTLFSCSGIRHGWEPCVCPATSGAEGPDLPRPNDLWFWTLGWSESNATPPLLHGQHRRQPVQMTIALLWKVTVGYPLNDSCPSSHRTNTLFFISLLISTWTPRVQSRGYRLKSFAWS